MTSHASPDPGPALVVVDVQEGFDDPSWGPRNNPAFEQNLQALIAAFTARGLPRVHVRHDSDEADSPLHPSSPGNRLEAYVDPEPDLLVTKQVNSAFHGTPDLHAWLSGRGIGSIVVTGITTNHCCETTARVGGNLGYDVVFVTDATHTFDLTGPDGRVHPADEVAAMTSANLDGEFATVLSTAQVLETLPAI